MTTEEIMKRFDEKVDSYGMMPVMCIKNDAKSFIREALEAQKKQIHTDLIAIADEGEYEDLRREVERYFNLGKK